MEGKREGKGDGERCEFSISVQQQRRKEKKEHSRKKSVNFSTYSEAFFHRKVEFKPQGTEVIPTHTVAQRY